MSQDVNSPAVLEFESADSSEESQPEAESLQEVSSDASGAVDDYADSLMDELFEDVNQILERGAKLPIEPAPPEFVSLQPIAMPRLILPPGLMPQLQPVLAADAELEALIEPTQPLERNGTAIDRFLLVAVFASAIAAAASWLVFHFQQPPSVATAPSADELNAEANAQFSDYLRRSLDTIDRRTAANRVASLPVGTTLPSVAVPGTTAPSPPTVLERVYVPVYQPPQTLNPQIGVAPVAPVAPTPAPVAVAPIAPAAPIAPVPSARPAPAPVAVVPTVPHVLVGVMQLGDRSAALFEVNGVAQRSYIGENIGTSGWTLVSVSDQEAVIRRNGEVRSIYVGQQL